MSVSKKDCKIKLEKRKELEELEGENRFK